MRHQHEKIFLALAVLMMVLIFISSSMTYHQQTIVPEINQFNFDWLRKWLAPISINYAGHVYSIKTEGLAGMIEFLLRKTAHFGNNLLLGLFAYLGLTSAVPKFGLRALLVWLSATGYAATDEFHQLLTGDRTPMIQDVMLDSSGALVGVLLAMLIAALIVHHQRTRGGLRFR
ncbi:membrane protein [Lapidilactobacillus concavus]|nr:VanZ family protein [Lapidilactobacillus concavus]GEL12551.1 membrane protein [Lapidilactobacillus concavus]